MATQDYSPQETARYFDEVGMAEWERLNATPLDEVSLHVHRHYLNRHVQAGMRVLEIGAGPGRFTQALVELGARVRVVDLSAEQLALNRQLAQRLGFAAPGENRGVEGWDQADICDLSRYPENAFDAVVAYGGPFSYVLSQRDVALAECLRVLRPGGPLLLSVMSLWGTVHWSLPGVLAVPVANNQFIIASGDLIPQHLPRHGNSMHLFRAEELRAWLQTAGLQALRLSASFCLSTGWNERITELRQDEATWAELLRMEVEAAAEPGCLDMGTHLIAVGYKGVRAHG